MSIPSNRVKRKTANPMPVTDDCWWESVLADERQHSFRSYQPLTAQPKQVHPPRSEPAQATDHAPANWDAVKELFSSDRILTVRVTGHNRGGLLVEADGLSGFVPYSHLVELAGREPEANREVSLEAYAGKLLNVKVIECTPEEGRVVFSERAALAGPGKRSEIFHSLHTGEHVKGIVTNITDFGVFVDLGGVEGLIHISELSWGRVSHPNQIVSLGDEVDVQVLDISAERCRVALSVKRLIQNPWERAESEFAVNSIQPAVVTSVLSYGSFARLDAGVEGLIHASEMPLAEHQTPRDILTVGQQIQVRVLHVDSAHQRLGLSMKLSH